MMKISKSKHKLAQLLIEAGVKQFPRGANWVAQDKCDLAAVFSSQAPTFYKGRDMHFCNESRVKQVVLSRLTANWHQTKLSRAEFDKIVAETAPDADGWIEWNGVPRSHVSKGTKVDVKMQNGTQHFGQLIDDECWSDCWGDASIIAYRLHKPEQVEAVECNGSVVVRTGSVQSNFVVAEKPTLDQLLQDWRNADDFAKRKQAEADEAAAMRDERWESVQVRAGEIGVTIGERGSLTSEHKLEITDWRDLQLNDIIEYVDGDIKDKIGMTGPVVEFAPDATDGMMVRMECDNGPRKGRLGWPMKWRFIRRP